MQEELIYSKNIVTPEGIEDGYLRISQGKIVSITDKVPFDFKGPITDAEHLYLMPGLVDPHVHINEPGRTHWEGFETATLAAAASGITTLVDMPLNSSPVTINEHNFQIKLKASEDKLNVNVGFWGGVVPGNENELDDLLKGGVLGLKAFMTHSGIDDFPNSEYHELKNALLTLKKYGRPLLVHCELSADHPGIDKHKGNPTSYKDYLASRPKDWENKAIEQMIQLCRETKSHVHIVHLSSAEALSMIEEAKAEGLPLSVETAQHYLVFCAEEIPDGTTMYKCAPPIREKANNELLWQALKDGLISFVATDHSPAPPELKESESGNLYKAWGGIAGLQFALSSFWTAAHERGFTVTDVAKWLAENPADFLQMKNKGRLVAGADADLFIWNPKAKISIGENEIHHRHKISPYANREWLGQVIATYVNGVKVYENGMLKNPHQGHVLLKK